MKGERFQQSFAIKTVTGALWGSKYLVIAHAMVPNKSYNLNQLTQESVMINDYGITMISFFKETWGVLNQTCGQCDLGWEVGCGFSCEDFGDQCWSNWCNTART